MIYAYPFFGNKDLGLIRFGGAGLGNILIPWARAVISCERSNFTLINPTWPSLKIGPLLRRESDLRFYGNLFRPIPGSVTGVRKLLLLATRSRVSEEEYFKSDKSNQCFYPGRFTKS